MPQPQRISQVLVHLVFSTKRRRAWFDDAVRDELHGYIASVLNASDNVPVRVGGTADHVHVAFYLGRTQPLAKVVEKLKSTSSTWIIRRGPEYLKFRWQRGYAAFSVGLSDRAALIRYIDEQSRHHERRDFQTEMRAMFTKYGVAYDEQFVWD